MDDDNMDITLQQTLLMADPSIWKKASILENYNKTSRGIGYQKNSPGLLGR